MPDSPQSSTLQRLPVWLLFLLATVGVPSAAAMAMSEKVTANPLLAVAIWLLWEIMVFLAGITAKVWQRLESRWVDRIADWLDEAIQRLFSGYRKRYLQHLIYRHRTFDVKGLSTQGTYTLELEQVFVELGVAPTPGHLLSTDPIHAVPEELQSGRHTIWDYPRAEGMNGQHLAVIGSPGSGKTTLLKHMTLTLAAPAKQRKQVNAPDLLPILLFLRNHAASIVEKPDLTLDEAVHETLTKWKLHAPPRWFEDLLKNGKCLVMLDGLDEVADPVTRQKVVAWVERQMEIYPKNRFVTTSRPFGYQSNPLSGVTVLEVQPFTRAQVERFVHNWYTANEIMSQQKDDPGARMAAQEGAEDLLTRLRSAPNLADLAVNPLLLTMIATVHRYRSSLPGRRVELYAEICEVFLGKRQQAKGLELDLTPAQKQRVLQPLAYHLMCHESREIALADAETVIAKPLQLVSPETDTAQFLKSIENGSGLLVERENGVYSFSHLTFQEYLAAVHVQEQRLGEELVQQVTQSWWHETIRLYAARTDASPVIAACLAGASPSIPALLLAMECREEALEIQPEVREQLEEVLDRGVEDSDPERRRMVAETLLAYRLHHLSRVDDNTYVDNGLITHAEYQLFLDEKREQGKFYQPDHWLAYQFPPGLGREPVVGVRSSDADVFCQWLTKRDVSGWRYRLPQVEELDVSLVFDGTTGEFTSDIGYWVTGKTQSELERIHRIDTSLLTARLLNTSVESDRATAFSRAVDRYLAFALGFALSRACNLARDRRDHAFARDLARDLERDLYLDLDLDLERDLYLDLDLDLYLDLYLARDRDRDLTSDQMRARRKLNRSICWFTLKIGDSGQSWLTANRVSWTNRLTRNREEIRLREQVEQFTNAYLDLYVAFAILEGRIEGDLQAFEGIRIVRERAVPD